MIVAHPVHMRILFYLNFFYDPTDRTRLENVNVDWNVIIGILIELGNDDNEMMTWQDTVTFTKVTIESEVYGNRKTDC